MGHPDDPVFTADANPAKCEAWHADRDCYQIRNSPVRRMDRKQADDLLCPCRDCVLNNVNRATDANTGSPHMDLVEQARSSLEAKDPLTTD